MEKSILQVLSENVKYYRFKQHLTQEELAEELNISSKYVSDIENMRGNVPLTTLEEIAYVLNVKPYLLIKEQEHEDLPKRVNMK